MQTATLKCDKPGCGWNTEIPFADIPAWHNKPCPDCNDCIIMNDEDMGIFYGAQLAITLTETIDPKKKLPRKDVLIDTAPLRSGV